MGTRAGGPSVTLQLNRSSRHESRPRPLICPLKRGSPWSWTLMTNRFRWASEIAALINENSRIEFLNHTGWSDRPKRFAELTTPARLLLRLRPIGLALRAIPPLRGGECNYQFNFSATCSCRGSKAAVGVPA